MSTAPKIVIESPGPGENVSDEAIFISGFVELDDRDPASFLVRASIDGRVVAETQLLFPRPTAGQFGFRMVGRIASANSEPHDVVLRVAFADVVIEQTVRLIPAHLRDRPYGDVVSPENEKLLHRENIYGSGPPIEEPGVEVSDLLRSYLPERASVVDVGCGAGAYGPPLMASGHEWLGLEANDYCCDVLTRRRLPFRKVDLAAARLPAADGEFDSAICIEVLEHTKDPATFASEIARIIRHRALFSVPNLELLPYLHDWRVVPWHLLEGDHKNFFTRASLHALLSRFFRRVEIFPYGEHPLRTRDGVPLFVHFFAVADK